MKIGINSKILLCIFVFVCVFGVFSYKAEAANASSSPSFWEEGFVQTTIAHITYGVLSVINTVLGWVGTVFDTTIEETILKANIHFGETGQYNKMVTDIWKIFRDIGNIIIIFSLLYLAIRTILQGEGFADTKTLSSILIAAIFINFSLLFVKLAFDVSNTVSVSIYNQMRTGEYATMSFSAGVMKIVNFAGLMDSLNGNFYDWGVLWKTLSQALLLGVLCIILGFIFIAASIMLIYRFFIFLFLMISSPLGLVSRFVPWLSSQGKQWWEELKKQSIALPVFFVALYIALYAAGTVFYNMSQTITNTGLSNPTSSGFDLAAIGMYIFQFILLVLMLGFSLFAPGYVGGVGSGVMTNAGKKLRGYGSNSIKWMKGAAVGATVGTAAGVAGGAARLTLGGAALTGRGVFGKIGRRVANNEETKQRAQEGGIGGWWARRKLDVGNYLGKEATYDVRNIKIGKKTIGERSGTGEGIKGWKETVDKKKKAAEEAKEKAYKKYGFEDAKKKDKGVKDAKDAVDDAMEKRDQATEAFIEAKRKGIKGKALKSFEDERKMTNEVLSEMQTKLKAAEEEAEIVAGAKYINIAHSRMNRIINAAQLDASKNTAIKEMAKETEKSWWKDKKKRRVDELKNRLRQPDVNYTLRGS